jgi:hypothetical protein
MNTATTSWPGPSVIQPAIERPTAMRLAGVCDVRRRPPAADPRQRGRDRYRRPSAPLHRHTARPARLGRGRLPRRGHWQPAVCGDLFTAVGKSKALVNSELVGPAMLAEDMYAATCLTPQTGAAMRRLAQLESTTLALMPGPSYAGDGAIQLRGLADAYDEWLHIEGEQIRPPVQRPGADKII